MPLACKIRVFPAERPRLCLKSCMLESSCPYREGPFLVPVLSTLAPCVLQPTCSAGQSCSNCMCPTANGYVCTGMLPNTGTCKVGEVGALRMVPAWCLSPLLAEHAMCSCCAPLHPWMAGAAAAAGRSARFWITMKQASLSDLQRVCVDGDSCTAAGAASCACPSTTTCETSTGNCKVWLPSHAASCCLCIGKDSWLMLGVACIAC